MINTYYVFTSGAMTALVTHEYRVMTEDMVNVFITSNCNSFTSEKKFAKDLTVAALKNKLELITGASALSMTISVFDKKDNKVCVLADADALLGSFPVRYVCCMYVLMCCGRSRRTSNCAFL